MRILPVLGGKSFGVKSATLALSVSAHAAIALVAAHGGSLRASAALEGARPVELPAPELSVLEETANWPREPVRAETESHHARRAHHTHPYLVADDHDVTPHDPWMPHIALPGRAADPLPAPAVALEPSTAPVHFVLTVGRTTNAPGGVVSAIGRESATPSVGAAPLASESVDTAATLLSGSAPAYTREAESAGVETDVPLEIVVDDRGSVVDARVLRRAGYGLDEVALASIRSYRFQPARRAGTPVAVRMRWLVRFELR